MSSLASKHAAGRQPARTDRNTALPRSSASEPARDWSKAVAHWRKIRENKSNDVSDHGTTLSTLNALKKDIVKTPDFPGKSDTIAIKHLASAQEEHRQAVRAVKAFKAHAISPKQLASQDISMMDAVLLLHTEDPDMTLGELREKMLNNAILVVPETLRAEFAKSDAPPVTKVVDSRRAPPSANTKGPLRDATNKPKKTGPHGKSQSFEPPSKDASTPVVKHKPAPNSLAVHRAATALKTTKTSKSGGQAKRPRNEDDKPCGDELAAQGKAPVTKRDAEQAFEETDDKPRKRQSIDSVEKASQITTDKTSTATAPIVKETDSVAKEPAVEMKSSDTTKSVDAPSVESSKPRPESLNDSDSAEVASLNASTETTPKQTVKLDEYPARKKAKKAKTTPDFQHSTSSTNQKTDGSEEIQAMVQEGGDTPPISPKEETQPEADIYVASAIEDHKEDVTKDETKESNQKSTSSGSTSLIERPAARKLAGRLGARKAGEAGVAVVIKKGKKGKKSPSPPEDDKDADDDDNNDEDEALEVDINAAARKALENEGLAADAILPGKRRISGGGSRSQTDRGRKPISGDKKQKRKHAEDGHDTGPNNKKARKIAVSRMRHPAPSIDIHDKVIGSLLTTPKPSPPAPSADVVAIAIDLLPPLSRPLDRPPTGLGELPAGQTTSCRPLQ